MTGLRTVGLFGLVLCVGCANKLNVEKAYEIAQTDRQIITLEPQSREQTVTAAVTADQPVDVFVLPASAGDPATIEAKSLKGKASASSEGVTTGTFKFAVPAKQETNIVVTPSAKTNRAKVTIKLTN
jgi:hypothetical protein